MNDLFLGTTFFAASGLGFGLAFVALRSPKPGFLHWRDSDVLVSLICAALAASIAMTVAGHTAFALSWKAEVAALGMPTVMTFGMIDLAVLALTVVLIGIGRRIDRRSGASDSTVSLVTGLVGLMPEPANSPTEPSVIAVA